MPGFGFAPNVVNSVIITISIISNLLSFSDALKSMKIDGMESV